MSLLIKPHPIYFWYFLYLKFNLWKLVAAHIQLHPKYRLKNSYHLKSIRTRKNLYGHKTICPYSTPPRASAKKLLLSQHKEPENSWRGTKQCTHIYLLLKHCRYVNSKRTEKVLEVQKTICLSPKLVWIHYHIKSNIMSIAKGPEKLGGAQNNVSDSKIGMKSLSQDHQNSS